MDYKRIILCLGLAWGVTLLTHCGKKQSSDSQTEEPELTCLYPTCPEPSQSPNHKTTPQSPSSQSIPAPEPTQCPSPEPAISPSTVEHRPLIISEKLISDLTDAYKQAIKDVLSNAESQVMASVNANPQEEEEEVPTNEVSTDQDQDTQEPLSPLSAQLVVAKYYSDLPGCYSNPSYKKECADLLSAIRLLEISYVRKMDALELSGADVDEDLYNNSQSNFKSAFCFKGYKKYVQDQKIRIFCGDFPKKDEKPELTCPTCPEPSQSPNHKTIPQSPSSQSIPAPEPPIQCPSPEPAICPSAVEHRPLTIDAQTDLLLKVISQIEIALKEALPRLQATCDGVFSDTYDADKCIHTAKYLVKYVAETLKENN